MLVSQGAHPVATESWSRQWVEIALLIIATISLVVLPVGRYLLFPELHNDFHFIFLGALALREGLNPYLPATLREISTAIDQPVWWGAFEPPFRRWTHPPISGVIVMPLTPLGETTAFLLYFLANLLCSVGGFWLVMHLSRSVVGHDRTLWRMMMLCLSAWPICTSLALGQVNGFIIGALALSAWGLVRGGRWGAVLAGAPLGFAAGLKILPGIFIAYLLLTRRWAAAAWALAVGLATLGLPALLLGPEITVVAFFRSLAEIAGGSAGMDNASLPGLLLRLYIGREGLYSGLAYELPSPWWQMSLVMSAGLVVWGLARTRTQVVLDAYFTLSVVVLLAAPVAWIHYVAWVLPFAVAPLAISVTTEAAKQRRILVWSLALTSWLPLHELVWTQRLPDLVVAFPWWQVGLLGLLMVAAAHMCSHQSEDVTHALDRLTGHAAVFGGRRHRGGLNADRADGIRERPCIGGPHAGAGGLWQHDSWQPGHPIRRDGSSGAGAPRILPSPGVPAPVAAVAEVRNALRVGGEG